MWSTSLHLYLCNTRSALPKIDFIRAECAKIQPTVFACTESWLHSGISDNLISIPNYSILRHDRDSRTGGGVLVFVSNLVNYCTLSLPTSSPSCIEAVWFHLPVTNVIFVCIYIPPLVCQSSVLCELIDTYLESNCDYFASILNNPTFIICGDFNSFKVDTICSALDLVNTVNKPTRGSSILDLCLVSSTLVPMSSISIYPPIINSDHNSVLASFICPIHGPNTSSNSAPAFKSIFDLRQRFIDKFVDHLYSIDWSLLQDPDLSLDTKCDLFHKTFDHCISLTIPKHAVPSSERDKPWISPFIKHLIHCRWSAFRNRDYYTYNKLSNLIKKKIVDAKKSWANSSSNNKSSSRFLWSKVNSILGKGSNDPLQHLTKTFSNKTLAANSFNRLFANVFTTAEHVDIDNVPCDYHVLDTFKISLDEVFRQLSVLKISKAAGPDLVPTILYKAAALVIAEPLTHIFNSSLSNCYFPSIWKRCHVIPIPKCNSPGVNDLRPISLLSLPAKIFEKIVFRLLKPTFNRSFGDLQFGFREKSSTECALIALHDHITSCYDDSKCLGVQVVAFDYSKAFDKLKHDVIVKHLLQLHFPFHFIKWLYSFLTGRSQSVRLGHDCISEAIITTSGVPQGSVLSPALFSTVISSLNPLCTSTCMIKFADDITLSLPIYADFNCVNSEVENVINWSKQVNLIINFEKCKYLFIPASRNAIPIPINFPQVNCIKLLGVIFSHDLSWDAHISYVKKVTSSRYFALKVLKRHFNSKQLSSIYISLVRSVMEYCSSLFVGLNSKNSVILNDIQNRFHRLICGHHCPCVQFPSLTTRRRAKAKKLFLSIAANPEHILFSSCPSKLRRTFSQPSASSSRRLNSFFPFSCILVNYELQ